MSRKRGWIMGSAAHAERDPPGPRKEVRRDLLEDLEREVAVGRELAVERREREPVGGREVAHDALQVAARRQVEDDVEGPGHTGIMSSGLARPAVARRRSRRRRAAAPLSASCASAAQSTERTRSSPVGVVAEAVLRGPQEGMEEPAAARGKHASRRSARRATSSRPSLCAAS